MAIRISGLNSGLDTDSIVQELVSAYSTKKDKYVKAQTKLSWKQDAWKEMNSKIYGFYSKSLWNMTLGGNYNKKTTSVSDATKAIVKADSTVVNGTQTLKVRELATAGYLTGKKLNIKAELDSKSSLSMLGITGAGSLTLDVGGKQKTVSFDQTTTIGDFVNSLNEQGVKANFDAAQKRFFISSASSGKGNDFSFVVNSTDQDALANLEKLGLATAANYETVNGAGTATEDMEFATKSAASNAIIELNSAVFENDTNEFSINGLHITATGVSDVMSITTATDTDGIYNMIKDFFKEYNTVVNAMEKAYNATSSKGYEPLTDDEKDEMSDTEIEKWESKIKDSLLRRDDTLNSVLSGMTMAMNKTYQIDGKTYSLSSFGIGTTAYSQRAENESYAYHINGDKDDSGVSGKEDMLRKAIETDPDSVMNFFSQLTKDVYNNLHEKMGTTEMSSIYTVYNDKQMQKEYNEYTETIKKWEAKVSSMEDYYYKKFSAMETALAKLQSQTNSLSSLLGG